MTRKKLPIQNTLRKFYRIDDDLPSYGYFCALSNNCGTNPRKLTIREIVIRQNAQGYVKAIIRSYSDLGLPTSGDLKKFLALLKIIQDKADGLIMNPVSFTTHELFTTMKYASRPNKKDYEDVDKWLDRMTNTTLTLEGSLMTEEEELFYGKDYGWSLFDRAKMRSRKNIKLNQMSDGNQIYLSEKTLQNLNMFRANVVNFDALITLSNSIAQLLVPLLQKWFFAGGGEFKKNYADICALLGITKYKYVNRIYQQLEPSLIELRQAGFIKSYAIKPNTQKTGFNLILKAGKNYNEGLKYRNQIFLRSDQIPGSDDLILDLPARQKKSEDGLSVEQKEFYEYLLTLGVFKQPALDILSEFSLDVLKRRTAWAIEMLEDAKKRKRIAGPGGFIVERLRSTDEIPDNYKTPEEKEAEDAENLKKNEEETRRREMQNDLEWAYGNYRNIQAEKMFGELTEGERKELIEKSFAAVKSKSAGFGNGWTAEKLQNEKIKFAILYVAEKNQTIKNFDDFCRMDTFDNLIEKYYNAELYIP